MVTTGTVRPATANSIDRDQTGRYASPIHVATDLAHESNEMITIKTSPTQAMSSIDLLRLLAQPPMVTNAPASSDTKSGAPFLSKTDTDSPRRNVMIGLRISRREIKDHDTSRSLALLNGLTQEKSVAWIARGRLVLSVDGYDDDQRELYEIPEVRRFINALHSQWKYWFFFSNETYATLQVVCNCILSGKRASPHATQVDANSFNKFYLECAEACGDLCDKFTFPEEANQGQLLNAYQQLTIRPFV